MKAHLPRPYRETKARFDHRMERVEQKTAFRCLGCAKSGLMVNEMEEGRITDIRNHGRHSGVRTEEMHGSHASYPAAAIQRRTCDSAMNRSENWEEKIGENEARK